jgi:uncharacterized protein
MTTSPTPGAPHPPAWKPLDPRQRRVLGVLIEKANTTPAGYPMTVNAIVAGCNQKNNRDPLTAYDDIDVEQALSALCELKAVSEIDWLGRVPKYKHHAYEWFGADRTEIAVLAELLLRGAQALGDLRARAARMAPIEDLAALKPVVDALVARGLVIELTPAGRGQVVSHNLHLPAELAEVKRQHAGHAPAGGPGREEPVPHAGADRPAFATAPAGREAEVLARLAADLASLREEVAHLRDRVGGLETRLGEAGS